MDVLRNPWRKKHYEPYIKATAQPPAKPLALHNTQWIFIISPTCFFLTQLSPANYIPKRNAVHFFTKRRWDKLCLQCLKKLKNKVRLNKLCLSTNVPQQVWQVFLFGDNNDEWLRHRCTQFAVNDSASLRMSRRMMRVLFAKKGRGGRRCPCVVRAERSTEVHLTDTVNKTCPGFYLSTVEKVTTNVVENIRNRWPCDIKRSLRVTSC